MPRSLVLAVIYTSIAPVRLVTGLLFVQVSQQQLALFEEIVIIRISH